MNRRELLKLLAMGVVGHTLDVDRLLWIPGEKKIFLPPITGVSLSEIIAAEYRLIVPHLAALFKMDDVFYSQINRQYKEK